MSSVLQISLFQSSITKADFGKASNGLVVFFGASSYSAWTGLVSFLGCSFFLGYYFFFSAFSAGFFCYLAFFYSATTGWLPASSGTNYFWQSHNLPKWAWNWAKAEVYSNHLVKLGRFFLHFSSKINLKAVLKTVANEISEIESSLAPKNLLFLRWASTNLNDSHNSFLAASYCYLLTGKYPRTA